MNFQKYKTLIIGGGICLILLAGGVFLLLKYRLAYTSVKRNLDSSTQTLSNLKNAKPFPAQENIDVVLSNRDLAVQGLNVVKDTITAGQVKPEPIRRADFPRLLEQTLATLRTSATNHNVTLPSEGFDFGFDRYAKGDLPDIDKVDRLHTQVLIVEKIAEILFGAGVRTLDSVERDVFETVKGRTLDEGMMPGGMDMPEAGGMMPAEEESDLYSKESFTLMFSTTDTGMWSVLNRFARDPLLISVKSIDLQNGVIVEYGEDRGRRPRRRTPAATTGEYADMETMLRAGSAAAAAAEAVPEGPEIDERSHDERVVAGRELAQATVAIDVYLLKTQPDEEEGETTEETSP